MTLTSSLLVITTKMMNYFIKQNISEVKAKPLDDETEQFLQS